MPKTSDVGFTVVDKGDYTKRSKVTIKAFLGPKANGEVTGRIYGLVR